MRRATSLLAILPLLPGLSGCGSREGASGPPSDRAGTSTLAAAPAPTRERSEPFVRVLGTAQDGGFPHAACDGPRCTLARSQPGVERLVASLAIVLPASEEVYLVDATPDLRRQLDLLADVRRPPRDGVDRAPIDGVFLTHAHIGHYLGLAFFGFEAVHTRGLKTYATPRMAGYLRSNGPWSQLVGLDNLELVELTEGVAVDLGGGVGVEPLRVPHRDEYSDTVGYRIEGPRRTLLYIPDCEPWSRWEERFMAALDGVDVALLDGAFYSLDELPGRRIEEIGHPLMGDTMDLLEERVAAGLEVHFTHVNHSNPVLDVPSAERLELEERGFALLSEGAELEL